MRACLLLFAALGCGDREKIAEAFLADADGDGFVKGDDCDDTRADVYPGAEEICNGVDDDCDGVSDGEDAVDAPTWYADADSDGYGSPYYPRVACDRPPDHSSNNRDCADLDLMINPGKKEKCNDIDDDCDGIVDLDVSEGNGTWFHRDDDGDGVGVTGEDSFYACEGAPGFAAEVLADDCDDTDPLVSPLIDEVCYNGVDNDCQGDDDFDCDWDGYVSADYGGDDCDDDDNRIHPAVVEDCDGVDQNCDGQIDEGVESGNTVYRDADGDGFGDADVSKDQCTEGDGFVFDDADCDDSEPLVNPDAVEVCGNGLDDDCDNWGCGLAGKASPAAADWKGAVADAHAVGTAVSLGADLDGDGQPEVVVGSAVSASDRGRIWVSSGPTSASVDLDLAADLILFDKSAGTAAGGALAGAGDLDGDGLDELLVGAHRSDSGLGAVWVVYGPATSGSFLEDVGVSIGGIDGGWLGSAVGGVAAVDGADGPGFVAGAPRSDSFDGSVYLFAGAITAHASASAAVASFAGQDGQSLGSAVCDAGDHDGDGLSELWVGAPTDDGDATNAGLALLLPGGTSGAGDADDALGAWSGESAQSAAGTAVSQAGDLNDDGYPDLLVGAPGASPVESREGSVFLLLGPATGSHSLSAAAARYDGGVAKMAVGGSLAMLGDSDGDGVPELVLGAPEAEQPTPESGAVFVVTGVLSGTVDLSTQAQFISTGRAAGDLLGTAVAGGDWNGDGLADLLMGAPGVSTTTTGAGAAYVFVGGPGF